MPETDLTRPSGPATIPAGVETDVRILWEFLSELREKGGITQTDLAEVLRIARNTLVCYETGRRRVTAEVHDRWVRAVQFVAVERAVAVEAIPATHLDRPEFAGFPRADERKAEREAKRLAALSSLEADEPEG